MEADTSIAIVVIDRLCVTALSLSSGFDVVGAYDNDGVGGNDGGEVGEPNSKYDKRRYCC